jgi:hypothetical protein
MSEGVVRLFPVAFVCSVVACGSQSEPASAPTTTLDVMTDSADECAQLLPCADLDHDGFVVEIPCCIIGFLPVDCDDTLPSTNPGADEICGDFIDNNCDGFVDEDASCLPCDPECEMGYSACSGRTRIIHCDDSTGCPLLASPVDCPGEEGCRDGVCQGVCVDADRDGFMPDCGPTSERDCDDTRGDVFPGNIEICDGRDNNCDTRTDENFVCEDECEDACTSGEVICTADGLSFIACERGTNGCTHMTGTVLCPPGTFCSAGACLLDAVCVDPDLDSYGPGCEGREDDCRPSDASSFPGATEVCDGLDNDCDDGPDEGGVCDDCSVTTIGSPHLVTPGETLYAVSCGTREDVFFGEIRAGSLLSIALSADAMVSGFRLGRSDGSTFVPFTSGFELGGHWALLWHEESTGGRHVSIDLPAGTPYRLATSLEAASCTADGDEPNNSPGGGTPVGALPFGRAGTICGTDRDYFVFDPPTGSVITAAIVHEGGNRRDLSVTVWRNGFRVAPSFAGPIGEGGFADGHHAFFRADLPGTYTVGVSGLSSAAANDYALVIDAATVACSDDSSERSDGFDNDTFPTARALAPDSSLDGVLCAGDYDIILIGDLRPGDHVSATLSHRVAAGNLDGRMLRSDWSGLVQERRTDNDDEVFDNNISSAGTYYFAIYGRTPWDSASYDFTYSVN